MTIQKATFYQVFAQYFETKFFDFGPTTGFVQIVVCNVISCHAVLQHAMSSHAMLWCAIQCLCYLMSSHIVIPRHVMVS